jgi:hypothetical protein
VRTNYTTARSLESVVEFRRNLLETRMESQQLGRMDARSVLESEQELFAARLEQLQSEIEYQRSLLELQLISGSLLQLRGIDVSLEDLEYRTRNYTGTTDKAVPGLKYTLAQYDTLPADEPVSFEQEEPAAPWIGIDWKKSDSSSIFKTSDNENSQNRTPRRFDGSHIN